MANLWLRIKVWFKVTLVAAVLVYSAAFAYINATEHVHFWYWVNHQPETNLLILVLCAFGAGIVATLLVRTTVRTLRQIHDIQHRSRLSRMDRQLTDIQTKAAMLQTKPPTIPTPGDEIGDESI